MTRMERLARRICWLGFIDPEKHLKGKTETDYWDGLPERTREFYRGQAQWLSCVAEKLNATETGREILQRAIVASRGTP
jgi:hypothetical protein